MENMPKCPNPKCDGQSGAYYNDDYTVHECPKCGTTWGTYDVEHKVERCLNIAIPEYICFFSKIRKVCWFETNLDYCTVFTNMDYKKCEYYKKGYDMKIGSFVVDKEERNCLNCRHILDPLCSAMPNKHCVDSGLKYWEQERN